MSLNHLIVDLDGTLALLEHRLHFLNGPKKDWDGFFKACTEDEPNWPVINTVAHISKSMSGEGKIYILSGRSEIVREETVSWLRKYIEFEYELIMRKRSDHRPDVVIKKEFVYDLGLNPDNVLAVFDDRQVVVNMWRESGFTCLQVADHDF